MILIFSLFFTVPALGHHAPDHEGGPPESNTNAQSTETATTSSSADGGTTAAATAPTASGGGKVNKGGSTGGSSTTSSSTTSSTSTTVTSQGATHGPQPTCTNKHPRTPTGSAYDSTCDGTASLNGNGTGGGGRPCAGCVGNADYKNPPGQFPDGTDANNGYECDGNSGVGKTNPAHSGCRPPVVPPPVPPGPPPVAPPPGPPPGPPPEVQPREIQPAEVTRAPGAPGELAFTGSTPGPLVAIALGLALLGIALIVIGRRQASTA
ncbi:MAG TPA: hypothetical protein VG602_09935 [Actinomycetota bacterium]|nr:hypothetical protein [Actinomycetota bacterium]